MAAVSLDGGAAGSGRGVLVSRGSSDASGVARRRGAVRVRRGKGGHMRCGPRPAALSARFLRWWFNGSVGGSGPVAPHNANGTTRACEWVSSS